MTSSIRFLCSALVAGLLFLSALPLAAQTPELVINPHTGVGPMQSSDIRMGVTLNGVHYFRANDGIHGEELWRSDGTQAGTWLVKDILMGASDSWPNDFAVFGDEICFSASDGSEGRELWCSDGTEAGTRQVHAIRPGPQGSNPSKLTVAGGWLYFSADDGVHGQELWRSDGTQAGTHLVRDIRPGPQGAEPDGLAAVGDLLLFAARTDALGRELWRSDGTGAGTVNVVNLGAGASSSIGTYHQHAVHAGWYYFAADAGNGTGTELWRSNGTSANTHLVKDINPGAAGSLPKDMHSTSAGLLFSAYDGNGYRLWRSNGSAAGTLALPGSGMNLVGRGVASLHGFAYFVGDDGDLWRTDGTVAGTVAVGSTNPGGNGIYDGPVAHGDSIYISADTPDNGYQLHRWSGSGSLTRISNMGSVQRSLVSSGDVLLFISYLQSTGHELWRYAPSGGIQLVANIAADGGSSWPRIHGVAGGRLLFSAYSGAGPGLGRQMWASDGSTAGSELLPGHGYSTTFHLDREVLRAVEHAGALYYMAGGSGSERVIWRSDGSAAGTGGFLAACPGPCLKIPWVWGQVDNMISTGNHLVFEARIPSGGNRIFHSDGSEIGTLEVSPPILLHNTRTLRPMAAIGDTVYLQASPVATVDRELWKIQANGVASLVRDIHPTGQSMPEEFTPIGNTLFFVATDGGGRELWKSDGSYAGTVRVRDIMPGEMHGNPRHLTAHQGVLYFTANDGQSGRELWRSDGTPTGTWQVKDIHPGPQGSFPHGLTSTASGLYFAAHHPDTGMELWRSDGSPEGTRLVADIAAGPEGSLVARGSFQDYGGNNADNPFYYADYGEIYMMLKSEQSAGSYERMFEMVETEQGHLVFRACTRSHGCQLWISDGTAAGTRQLTDFGPLPGGASPGHLTLFEGRIYFSATDALGQRALWRIGLPEIFSDGFESP